MVEVNNFKIPRNDIEDIIALTPGQEGMLFHYLEKPGGSQYFEQLVIKVSGGVDDRCFREAWNLVVENNEMLRTFFVWEKVNNPIQVILKKHAPEVLIFDLTELNPAEKSQQLHRLKHESRSNRFELGKVPLRLELYKLEAEQAEMVICYHHIICDGWSSQIMLREFFRHYQSLWLGEKPLIHPKPKFKEFIKYLQQLDKNQPARFWKEHLTGVEARELGINKHAPARGKNAVKTFATKSFQLALTAKMQRELNRFVKNNQVTQAAVFYSAWGILLQKYGYCEDVVFGITVSGRPGQISGMEQTVGLFINTLPLRFSYEGSTAIGTIIAEVHRQLLAYEDYLNTPLVDIKRYSGIKSAEQLFDTLVIMENYPLDPKAFNGDQPLKLESYSIAETTNYGLTVSIEPFDAYCLKFSYYQELYSDPAIRNLAHHLLKLLEWMTQAPVKEPPRVEILSQAEKREILINFNQTDACFPKEKTLLQLFEEQALKTPDHPALIFGDQRLTYQEFQQRVNRWAGYLKASGVKEESVVAILAERSLEMITGIFSILWAGGAYLPVDPNYPPERVRYLLEDSGAEVLVTQKKFVAKLREQQVNALLIDEADLETGAGRELEIQGSSTNLAYVIYTSGSTGKPKGVMIEHQAIVNRIHWMQKAYPLGEQDRILQKTPVTFDVSVWELFWWSLAGAGLCLLGPGEEKSPARLISEIERHQVTTLHFVPSMLAEFLGYLEGTPDIGRLKSLRRFFVSGEALSVKTAAQFQRLLYERHGTELVNLYGPTEAAVDVSHFNCSGGETPEVVPIGRPIDNIKLYITAPDGMLQPVGVAGELWISGAGLARGYLNRPELTVDKFAIRAFRESPPVEGHFLVEGQPQRIYRTGDLARWAPDGNVEFIGRMDHQVKVRGFRIELGEIETALQSNNEIKEVAAVVKTDECGDKYLVAYYTADREIDPGRLRSFLAEQLPAYMVPSFFVRLDGMPLSANGKLNRKFLQEAAFEKKPSGAVDQKLQQKPAGSGLERVVADIWREALGVSSVGTQQNFFDLGGDSLKVIRVCSRLQRALDMEIPVTLMFERPTVNALVEYLEQEKGIHKPGFAHSGAWDSPALINPEATPPAGGMEIAIIGISGRFPGARNPELFWDNLKNGRESISFFSDDELREAGIESDWIGDPNYVKAKGVLDDCEYFDAGFFGYSPKEASIMDPQIRILHECVWEVLENAGYNPEYEPGKIGLFIGSSNNFHWLSQVQGELSDFEAHLLNDRDFLSTRIAYKLNLKGPSLTLQTACSTSLVAVDMAIQSINCGKCQMAIAGGVSITYPKKAGYFFQEGMINSPDGHCRAFDAQAQGTLMGNGIGLVMLKSLSAALKDKDHIYAVIKGSAVNNDGSNKIGYTAPSIEGQVEVIRTALRMAQVKSEDIGYVETHGTGTTLGDPIEVEALKKAFNTNQRRYCALGSVKTNIGHLDVAAGSAGLIKTVLALKHRLIPPSLHFKTPNPQIDFENSPFYVNTELASWQDSSGPIRAGVSSFGIGGTNAHLILEEAPPQVEVAGENQPNLLLLSARSSAALDKLSRNLLEYMQNNPGTSLDDLAFTLQTGRKAFAYRKVFASSSAEEVIRLLDAETILQSSSALSRKVHTNWVKQENKPVAFMFPGVGSQYFNMLRELYEKEPIFHQALEDCLAILKKIEPASDLRGMLFGDNVAEVLTQQLTRIEVAQPIIFCTQYALARLMIELGVKPAAVIGYSFGEYSAACLAGIFSLEEALDLINYRGKLIQQLPEGAMLSVPLPAPDLMKIMEDGLSIAIDNDLSCVISGPIPQIKRLESELKKQKVICNYIQTSHALHSGMMESITAAFRDKLTQIRLNPPTLPYISNLTGTWIEPGQAVDPGYFADHLVRTVKFSEGLNRLIATDNYLYLEVGPGNELSQLLLRMEGLEEKPTVVNLVKPAGREISDLHYLLRRMGDLWLDGIQIHWRKFKFLDRGRRIPLPAYPFEQKYYWVNPKKSGKTRNSSKWFFGKNPNLQEWFYAPSWERSILQPVQDGMRDLSQRWLIFATEGPFTEKLVKQLGKWGKELLIVKEGPEFTRVGPGEYWLNPRCGDDYDLLVGELIAGNLLPQGILHLWSVSETDQEPELNLERINQALDRGFYSLIYLAQALGKHQVVDEIIIKTVTNNMHDVGADLFYPEKSTIMGPVKIIPLEYLNLKCFNIDIALPQNTRNEIRLIETLGAEILFFHDDNLVAYRSNYRWVPSVKPVKLRANAAEPVSLKEQGTYFITGGLGGVGLTLAEYLAKSWRANLILVNRTAFPERPEWAQLQSDPAADPDLVKKIKRLAEMENAGAQIRIHQADIADPEQVKAVVIEVEREFGRIDGVIHTAGVAEYDGIIQNKTRERIEKIFRPKIYGAFVLESVFHQKKLDFFFLCSSIASIIYQTKLGQVAYCSANDFIDALANSQHFGTGWRVLSVNWSDWQQVGMSVQSADHWGSKLGIANSQAILSEGILPEEGVAVFKTALESGLTQVIVSPEDLINKLENYKRTGALTLQEIMAESNNVRSNYERPRLSMDYLPPSNQVEERLCNIWQGVFGIEGVGIQDDFFELGGDSLKAITILTKVHQELGVRISLPEFMKNSNIEKFGRMMQKGKQGTSRGKSGFSRIPPAPARDYYVLSSIQQRIYILGQMEPEGTSYNMLNVWRIQGEVDPGRLKEAFITVINRHESLRTSFSVKEHQPVQLIHPGVELEWEFYRVEETEIPELIRRFKRPFELEKAPLLRVGLARISPDGFILLLDIHHIIADGIANNIILREVMAIYQGQELPILKIQYKDYAEWEKTEKEKEEFKAKEKYWLAIFEDGDIPQLNLPYDYPRPRIQSTAGRTLEFDLNPEGTEALKELAKKQETTLYSLLLSVFTILLAKLSGQEDIIIGTPVAGRNHADLEDVVGMFVNTLALRNYPQGSKGFLEYLKEVHERTMEAFERQEYPFEELVEKLTIERDVSRNPLFDVMFGLQNMTAPAIQIPGLSCSPYAFEKTDSQFDLSLDIQELQGRLRFTFEYCAKLFREETVERFSGYFQRLLAGICVDPQVKLMDLELLSGDEKERILLTLNQTGHDYPENRTVHQLFEEQAKKAPQETAVVAGERKLTYAELNHRANQLARTLIRHGVGANSIATLMAGPVPERVVGMLAIIKAGAAYLPLPLEAPPERIKYLLQDSRSRILLYTPELQEQVSIYSGLAETLLIPETQGIEPSGDLEVEIQPEDLVYLTYTSGTTGQPKGVMTSHRNLVNFISWLGWRYEITHGYQYISLTQYHFDPSAGDIFVTLTHGGTLHLVDKYLTLNKSELRSYITKQRIGIINAVPTLIKELLCGAPKLDSVRDVVSGGERLEDAVKDELAAAGYLVHNHYGPTETTIDSLAVQCGPGRVTIGRPIWNMRAYVLDSYQRLTPPGVPGELCLSGAGVSRGYFGAPELTAAKFINCPFEARTMMYRTGDQVKLNQELEIEYIGRMDEQVKIRGVRIELKEIETTLAQYPGLRDVVAVCREESPLGDGPLGRYIAAYYTGAGEIDPLELRSHLAEYLPESFIPACFTRLEKLPVTLNGKIDKSRLPKPDLRRASTYEPPSDAVEVYLSEIWRQVLQIDYPGVHDNFFQIGGSSLLIIKMKALLEHRYPRIHVIDLFTYPTIAKLAAYIRQTEEDNKSGNRPSLSLNSATVILAEAYFLKPGEASKSAEAMDFQFEIGPRILEKITGRSNAQKVEPIDIFTGLFLYLLAELSGEERITIPGIFGKGDELRLLTVNLSEINTTDELFQAALRLRKSQEPGYPIWELEKLQINPAPGEIIPLLFQKGPGSAPFNFQEKFDLVLEIRERQAKVGIAVEFNRKRLRQAKIENLIQLYLGLINDLAKE
ncbi:MAG TPA: amino acid adenylation domain-containing protein [Bacillota bacterium]|nr:amino acid adenylation domain-containing protein [Bacillota bacterium]